MVVLCYSQCWADADAVAMGPTAPSRRTPKAVAFIELGPPWLTAAPMLPHYAVEKSKKHMQQQLTADGNIVADCSAVAEHVEAGGCTAAGPCATTAQQQACAAVQLQQAAAMAVGWAAVAAAAWR